MKTLHILGVVAAALTLDVCSAGAPAFADDHPILCKLPRQTYEPHVYPPEQASPPLWMPDNRRMV